MKTLLRSVAPFLLLLLASAAPSAAWAATYTLPNGPLPNGCTANGSTVTCTGWFSLANNDVVIIDDDIITSPITIRITGGGTFNSAQVNVGGSPADLTIDAGGQWQYLEIGSNAVIVANVTAHTLSVKSYAEVHGGIQATGQVSIEDDAIVHGNIATTGQITINDDAIVYGDLTAGTSIQVEDGASIYGNIAATGQITINDDVVVHGHLTAGGSIQVEERSHIYGNLSSGSQIDISLDAMIEGNVVAQEAVINAGVIQGNVNAKGPVWLNGNGSCSLEVDGRLEPQRPGQSNTQACVRGYINAQNADHIERKNSGNVWGLVCDQNANEGPCAGAGGPAVSFYRIEHGGSVLTCEPLNVQVRACADANCLTEKAVSGAVNVQASGPQTFSSSGNYSNNSLASVSIPITASGTYTLTLTTVPEAATGPLQCQSPSGCQVTAVDSILRWSEPGQSTIRHQTAGVPFQLQVEAIRTDTNTSACVAALQGRQSLSVSLDCDDPGTCSSDGLQFSTLAGSQLTESPATSTRAVTFDGNGRAQLGEMVYEDAGRIRLQAAVTAGDTSISGWSNPFVVRPAKVRVKVVNTETYNNPEIFARAGDDLTVTLSALSATGTVTRNFGSESSPESLELLPPMALTTFSGVDGVVTGQLQLIQGGEYSGVVRYSEAGPARFTAWVASDNYLGSGAGASGYEDLGRFLPWEFRVEKVGSSAQMVCTDSASPFTYLGEPFDTKLRVSALNRDGGITRNYPDIGDGAIAKLVARDIDTSKNLTDRLEQYEPQEPPVRPAPPLYLRINWGLAGDLTTDGEGKLPTNTQIRLTRGPFDATDPADAGPYESVTIGVEIDDNEIGGPFVPLAGADFRADVDDCTADAPCTAVTLVEDARFVYGQMVLTDTMGSEFSDLPVTLQVHYWDGERFRLHHADQCTKVSVSKLDVESLGSTGPAGSADQTPVPVSNGLSPVGSLLLTAPHEAGEVRFTYEAPEWLKVWLSSEAESRDPSATATFGTYGGHDRIIHWRLVH